MTPAARISAAIGVLDAIFNSHAAEAALIHWSRASRFAGSKDRAAVRDLVFDALRCKRSCAALGGGEDGRAIMIGSLKRQGIDPADLFTGEGHAPAPLTDVEQAVVADMTADEAVDWPAWLWPQLVSEHGARATDIAAAQQDRAPVFIRTNLRRTTRDNLASRLADEGIKVAPHETVATALEVTGNARKLQQTTAWNDGLFDMQDAASQCAIERLGSLSGLRILDYCAGGGGKSLAMADQGGKVTAHDADPARMKDIAGRASRAGVQIPTVKKPSGQFDLVLCDAPCSGSGTWRRAPDAKWRLTAARLAELADIQHDILVKVAHLVAPAGRLAYATCSVLRQENRDVVDRFLAGAPEWQIMDEMLLTPGKNWDGFYICQLQRVAG